LSEIRELPQFADGAKMAVVIDQAPCHMTIDAAREAAQLGMYSPQSGQAGRASASPWTSASSAC
jgi:hypothetical protein